MLCCCWRWLYSRERGDYLVCRTQIIMWLELIRSLSLSQLVITSNFPTETVNNLQSSHPNILISHLHSLQRYWQGRLKTQIRNFHLYVEKDTVLPLNTANIITSNWKSDGPYILSFIVKYYDNLWLYRTPWHWNYNMTWTFLPLYH